MCRKLNFCQTFHHIDQKNKFDREAIQTFKISHTLHISLKFSFPIGQASMKATLVDGLPDTWQLLPLSLLCYWIFPSVSMTIGLDAIVIEQHKVVDNQLTWF